MVSGRVAGLLPGPCLPANAGASDILEGQLLAYGVASSVAIIDVFQLQLVCMLHGAHSRASVTTVSWSPECHSRDLKGGGHVRLASGDKEGSVVVWDVTRVSVLAKLEDPRGGAGEQGGAGVQDVAWVMSPPCLLAVLLASASLLLWDTKGGQIVWRHEERGHGSLHSISVDPMDRRRVCLSGEGGQCIIMDLGGFPKDKVQTKQYRVSSSDGAQSSGSVHCAFPAQRDVLVVMLARELLFFDLEFAHPVSTIALPASRRKFQRILAINGEGIQRGGGVPGGMQTIHCLHEDFSLSVWVQSSDSLKYSLLPSVRLTPMPLRVLGSSTAQVEVLTMAAASWTPGLPNNAEGDGRVDNASNMEGHKSSRQVSSLLVMAVTSSGQVWQWDIRMPLSATQEHTYQDGAAGSRRSKSRTGTPVRSHPDPEDCGSEPQAQNVDKVSTLDTEVQGVSETTESASILTESSRVGESPQPGAMPTTLGDSKAGRPTVSVSLKGILHVLPSAITTLTVLPKLLVEADEGLDGQQSGQQSGEYMPSPGTQNSGISGDVHKTEDSQTQNQVSSGNDPVDADGSSLEGVKPSPASESATSEGIKTLALPLESSLPGKILRPVIGVVTSSGTLEVVHCHRGTLTPLSLEVSRSISVHDERARSVRWLGSTPLVVSFCSEKSEHGWKNSLVITDIRTGQTTPFRELGSENSSMLGIRTSPSGKYILVLLKNAPAEIWMVSGLTCVRRVRQLDLPFTAVEWFQPTADTGETLPVAAWEMWGCESGEAWEGGVSSADPPEETIVFALGDGRVGTVTIRGRQVTDSKLRKPIWGMATGANSAVFISTAGWGSTILLGDSSGVLMMWDIATGKTTTTPTEMGAIRRISVTHCLTNDGSRKSHVVLLSSSWQCSFWEIDSRNKLVKVPFQSSVRFMDMAWLPSPGCQSSSNLLAAVTEEGSLAVLEIDSASQGSGALDDLLTGDAVDGPVSYTDCLSGNPSFGSSLLLPRPMSLLLRLMIQVGVPSSVLRHMASGASDADDEGIEAEVWARLPRGAQPIDWGDFRGREGLDSLAEETSSTGEDMHSRADSLTGSDRMAGMPPLMSEPSLPPVPKLHIESLKKRQKQRARAPPVPAELSLTSRRHMSLASEVLASHAYESSTRKKLMAKVRTKLSRPRKDRLPEDMQVTFNSQEGVWSQGGLMMPVHNSLADVLRALASLRAQGQLMFPREWVAYDRALEMGSTTARMAVAAEVSGEFEEARFWRHVTPTLRHVHSLATDTFGWQNETAETGAEEARTTDSDRLWNEAMVLSVSAARVRWHEAVPRSMLDPHPHLQDHRMLEYVCLGDYPTAVGFLLASAPEASTRYYRDSLCALALSTVPAGGEPPAEQGQPTPKKSSLNVQVAKVVSAHAATSGDSLLGVPMLCSAGLPQEAVGLLQDAGLWEYAATLVSVSLRGSDRAQALARWAQHVLREEGNLWRATGLLIDGGCLHEALQVLRDAGRPDCAWGVVMACCESGLVHGSGTPQSGAEARSKNEEGAPVQQLFNALPLSAVTRFGRRRRASDDDAPRDEVEEIGLEFNHYVVDLFGHL
ncbi:unnamed protein product [Ostreobium quekettii]|uniref:Uncharacterized protein n=1 Tax=Ostreobium quekettii TaxID=121088 RepID=A0A8S1J9A0_9CHLO|nr:unnamed protein product [Ostreobium quekettii]